MWLLVGLFRCSWFLLANWFGGCVLSTMVVPGLFLLFWGQWWGIWWGCFVFWFSGLTKYSVWWLLICSWFHQHLVAWCFYLGVRELSFIPERISYRLLQLFLYSELLWQLFYSSLRSDCSRLILYDTFIVLSVSSTADFLLIDYFSYDYSSWLISYDILSQIDLVCAPDPLVYKLLVQAVFFSFDLG